ncbi:hypothetical protein Tco_0586328 [Tanacetum coccineum]
MVESLSPLPTPFGDSDSLLEETDTLLSHSDDSLPDYETFCFDIEEKSSGKITSHSDHSAPDYEAFCFDIDHREETSSGSTTSIYDRSLPDYEVFFFEEKSSGSTSSHSNHSLLEYESFCFVVDHIKEKSSGNTTSHFDLSLPKYELFHFDLMIDPPPPADRSVSHHEEFADELVHIISPPEYDRFYFDIEIVPRDFTRVLKENISRTSTKDFTIHKLKDFPLLLFDYDSIFSKEFSEIDLLVSLPSGNKGKVFYPEIFIIKGVQSEKFHILPLDDFSIILFVSNSLLLTDPPEIETFLSFPAGNEDKVFDPGILFINGVFSLQEKLNIF